MKVKQFKNGCIKLTAETKKDSEHLYMFLSGGKHSYKWFEDRIGKQILMIDKDGHELLNRTLTITHEAHAHHLFAHWQDLNYKFCDMPTS